MAQKTAITVRLTATQLAKLDAEVAWSAEVGNPKTRDQIVGYLITFYAGNGRRDAASTPLTSEDEPEENQP